MEIECFKTVMPSGSTKKIGNIYQCKIKENQEVKDLEGLKELVNSIVNRLGLSGKIELSENESIGTSHMLYKFNLFVGGKRCSSIRVVLRNNALVSLTLVLSEECSMNIETGEKKNPSLSSNKKTNKNEKSIPPGQVIINDFIIYRILGQPHITLDSWKLKIFGEVEKSVELSYEELYSLGIQKYKGDFHCVTGWSVRDQLWEGVPTKELAKIVKVRDEVEWVLTYSADGYTAIIPIEDFFDERSMIVLKLNGKVLSQEQGYPARLFIPHLYGWKGGKWLTGIEFKKDYSDGYWEALGYHERGNVWLEERFKNL
ncbi:MAG: sulfite oxidase-like oxidoreductase [Fervidicoccaceae archaeon]